MDNGNIRLLTRKDLIVALLKAGLPCSKPYLNKREEEGIISRPRFYYEIKGRFNKTASWRFFTDEEIYGNVEKIKKFEASK